MFMLLYQGPFICILIVDACSVWSCGESRLSLVAFGFWLAIYPVHFWILFCQFSSSTDEQRVIFGELALSGQTVPNFPDLYLERRSVIAIALPVGCTARWSK